MKILKKIIIKIKREIIIKIKREIESPFFPCDLEEHDFEL